MSLRYTSKPALVRETKKSVHFTVTPIGGKEELKQWKLDQMIKEEQFQAKRAETKAKVIEAYANGSLAIKWADKEDYGTKIQRERFEAVRRMNLASIESKKVELKLDASKPKTSILTHIYNTIFNLLESFNK